MAELIISGLCCMFIHWSKPTPGIVGFWELPIPVSSPNHGKDLLMALSISDSSPSIPGCRGRLGLKNGGGQIKNGVATGSISQIETRFCLSPALDSSHPTWILRHCELGHFTGSRSLMPVMVPIYLRTPDSSVSNIILNRMPSETWVP